MCREKYIMRGAAAYGLGSPLRVQGKVANPELPQQNTRITPACAGKRKYIVIFVCSNKDHPCVCREKGDTVIIRIKQLGSPLRVQGKEFIDTHKSNTVRITPACAGKRYLRSAVETIQQDHPCVCREKKCILDLFFIIMGSPLRVQGKD